MRKRVAQCSSKVSVKKFMNKWGEEGFRNTSG